MEDIVRRVGVSRGSLAVANVEALVRILDGFLQSTPDVESAAVVTQDGFPVVCALPDRLAERRLAAMSASIAALGERALGELRKGKPASIFAEGDQGHAAVVPAGRIALLVVTTFDTARIGLVLYEMKKAAQHVARVVDRDEISVSRPEPAELLDLTEEPTQRGQRPSGYERELS
jgi:predicted regulator of Ras-like GTPase activity (Roadblock/LC7/MglB family)